MKFYCVVLLMALGIFTSASAYDLSFPGSKRTSPRPRPPADQSDRSKAPPTENETDTEAGKEADATRKDLTSFIITIDNDAKDAKLIIPRSIISQLQAEADKSNSILPTGLRSDPSILSPVGTVVGGVLLAFAFLFGGLWLMQKRKLSAVNFGAIVFVLLLTWWNAATYANPNYGPPPEARSLTGKIFTKAVHLHKHARGEVQIGFSNDRDYIELIVPDSK